MDNRSATRQQQVLLLVAILLEKAVDVKNAMCGDLPTWIFFFGCLWNFIHEHLRLLWREQAFESWSYELVNTYYVEQNQQKILIEVLGPGRTGVCMAS